MQSVLLLEHVLLLNDQPPNFPNLETFSISKAELYDEKLQKIILKDIFATSPNLKKIFLDDWLDPVPLEIIPEQYYALLGNLEITFDDDFQEGGVLRNILDKKPKLRQLMICEPLREGSCVQDLKHFLPPLLIQSCQESLDELSICNCAFPTLALISHTPLKGLSSLSLQVYRGNTLDGLWNSLGSIDGNKLMPKLENIKLELESSSDEGTRRWPPSNPEGHVRYRYSSVRKLTLDLYYVTVNLMEIRTTFPNLTTLELILYVSEHPPYGELWELWPNLEELNIKGAKMTLRKNYDAEFCGINEEEAELLRKMDDEYLRNVHLVPIRPSLLTMQSKDY